MSFEVLLHPKVVDFLNKCDKHKRESILKKLNTLKENPRSIGKPLNFYPCWSLRIGKHRIIYKINEEKNTVYVADINHRKEIYTKLKK